MFQHRRPWFFGFWDRRLGWLADRAGWTSEHELSPTAVNIAIAETPISWDFFWRHRLPPGKNFYYVTAVVRLRFVENERQPEGQKCNNSTHPRNVVEWRSWWSLILLLLGVIVHCVLTSVLVMRWITLPLRGNKQRRFRQSHESQLWVIAMFAGRPEAKHTAKEGKHSLSIHYRNGD